MGDVLTIRLDEATARALDAEAKRIGASKGEVVRAAIRERLASARPSAFDALRDLEGVMEGPSDLSTNKRHLSSFGQPQPPARSKRRR